MSLLVFWKIPGKGLKLDDVTLVGVFNSCVNILECLRWFSGFMHILIGNKLGHMGI